MLLLTLLACPGVSTPKTCAELVPQPLAACVGGAALVFDGYGSVAADADVTVVSVASGALPSDCEVWMGGAGDATILGLEDADGGVTTLALAGMDIGLTVGDAFTLQVDGAAPSWGPEVGVIRIVDAKGAERLVYTVGGAVADLVPPQGVTVSEGALVCTEADGCGDWAASDLEVTVDGQGVTVPYGESATAGGWTVLHGGFEEQTEPGTTCPDYFVAHVEVAFLAG